MATWPTLGPAANLLSIEFGSFTSAGSRAGTHVSIDRDGTADAILVTFSADLAEDSRLVHRPRVDEISSCDASVWFLPDGPDGLTCEPLDTRHD